MSDQNLFIGDQIIIKDEPEAYGKFVTIEGEDFYEICNYDTMNPFLICLASNSDLWMYVSSTGGVTAGRKNPDNALFPYYTDDKIHETFEITGNKSIFHIKIAGKTSFWEPFSIRHDGIYHIERNIYKSTAGNKLIFEENNLDFRMTFRYAWMNADQYGWIKKSQIINNSDQTVEVTLLDGFQNILPYGVDRFTQSNFSTLVDAYKKSELIKDAQLALFRLESIPIDKAEPSEALKVTTVWSSGFENAGFLISSRQLEAFRKGFTVKEETETKGIKGSFFVTCSLTLPKGESKVWYLIADVSQDSAQVINLIEHIQNTKNLASLLEENILQGTNGLRSIVEDADGIQHSADKFTVARHYSNVLFNVMRGGIFSKGYFVDAKDFEKHLRHFNHSLWKRHKGFLGTLPGSLSYIDLDTIIEKQKDTDLYRLYLEYLPLTFSRRHGDPSRPWNAFSINIKDSNGNKLLYYQGNWRDIFQNWEALSISFPEYIDGIIAKFVNASTADGYNPYRVTRDGIDWEIPEPENPWANIGYWGDHQIIYLLRLMEESQARFPGRLISWLDKNMFAYANVPYRMKPYHEILKDPHNSIKFNAELNESIERLVQTYGADAKLILKPDGEVLKVTFTEKLLVPLLAKLSNFVPEAGIWMNTLRPEWNDANNALVGHGVSMVTLYNIRRYLSFISILFTSSSADHFKVSEEVATLMNDIDSIFYRNMAGLAIGFNDKQRKQILDELGTAGSNYREKVYQRFSDKIVTVNKKELLDFLNCTLQFVDQSILANKRSDGMYNAYNIISIRDDSISIRYLYEMLEGQVAVMSSGKLSADETLEVLKAMRFSPLYRADQESYILYPNKTLPTFLHKNNIPSDSVSHSKLLQLLITKGDTRIIIKDMKGQYHFNGTFRNGAMLGQAMRQLQKDSALSFSEDEFNEVLAIYEKMFDHQSFTGRSGTFYKYEGLGSIYWHMVSKLLLSIGENYKRAFLEGASGNTLKQLAEYYIQVKKGIGAHKSPKDYGSFPFDPYSHTPSMTGVQQPGMTGQVKEDIISRFFELGIIVENGTITIKPMILNRSEFIDHPDSGEYAVPYLSFSYCKVPFVYLLDNGQGIDMLKEGKLLKSEDYTLSASDTLSIMDRDGLIEKIWVHLSAQTLI